MKNLTPKAVLVPAIALLIICLVSTTLLAGTNMLTADKIAENLVKTETESRSLVLPAAKTYGEVQTLENGVTYCEGIDNLGTTAGYVFTTSAKGYGGAVGVMVGIDKDGVITGVEILSHNETPGLGANAVKPDFKNRFLGKSGELTVNKTSGDGQNVQAITAATITSKAVVNAVNMATDAFETLKGEGVK